MAEKLVGRKGRELAESSVTGKGGRTLPNGRATRKQVRGWEILKNSCGVEVMEPTNEDIYRLLHFYRFKWDGEEWVMKFPHFVKVVGEVPHGSTLVKNWKKVEQHG